MPGGDRGAPTRSGVARRGARGTVVQRPRRRPPRARHARWGTGFVSAELHPLHSNVVHDASLAATWRMRCVTRWFLKNNSSRRRHRLLWTICHREPIDTAIAHRPPESGHRWAFFCPSKDPSKYTLRWGLVNFHCLLRDQPNTDARVLLDNQQLRDMTCRPYLCTFASSTLAWNLQTKLCWSCPSHRRHDQDCTRLLHKRPRRRDLTWCLTRALFFCCNVTQKSPLPESPNSEHVKNPPITQ